MHRVQVLQPAIADLERKAELAMQDILSAEVDLKYVTNLKLHAVELLLDHRSNDLATQLLTVPVSASLQVRRRRRKRERRKSQVP